jgi:diaminopimelate epimerase
MARPILAPAKIPTRLGRGEGPVLDVSLEVPAELSSDGSGRVRLSSASMGNPHAVIEVEDLERAPVATLGAYVEQCDAFPNRVNVEFIQVVSRDHIRQRTWERGTGETLACGSGACAVAVTSMLRGAVDRRVRVELRGGDLDIAWASDFASVFMTGPAEEVFGGTIGLGDDEPLED